MKIKIFLYWTLRAKRWQFRIAAEGEEPWIPDYNPDGLEFHGEYIIDLPEGWKVCWKEREALLDIPGENFLAKLETMEKNTTPIPFVVLENGHRRFLNAEKRGD